MFEPDFEVITLFDKKGNKEVIITRQDIIDLKEMLKKRRKKKGKKELLEKQQKVITKFIAEMTNFGEDLSKANLYILKYVEMVVELNKKDKEKK